MAYGSALVDTIQSSTTGTPPQFNDGSGAQIGTLCRAWVNFNGASGSVAIRAAFNISSITYNGTGDYTLTFTTALSDANYGANISTQSNPANGPDAPTLFFNRTSNVQQAPTTSSFRVAIMASANGNAQDRTYVCVSVFR